MSLNSFLTRLIWLCVVPLLLAASWLAFESVRAAQSERDIEAANLARNLATAIDQHLQARIGALSVLAASPLADNASRRPDLYREAQGFRENFGAHVILADPEMNMLFNTRVPFGTALPRLPRPKGRAAAPAALETGVPAVGDVFPGPIAREALVAVVVPSQRDGKTNFLLIAIFETRQFQQRLDQLALPAGWSLALQDSTGAAIARRAPPGLNTATDVDASGRVVVRSALSPWSVVLEIPRDIYRAPLLATAAALALLILGATLVGVLGGRQAGRRLGESVASLVETPAPGAPPPEIAEIASVRRLLDSAAERRATAETALRASEQEARAAYERFERIFLGAPEAMSISDLESGRLILVNDAFCETFGYAREELIGHTSLELGLWTDLSRRAAITAALHEGRKVSGMDGQTRRHNGELREMLYSAEAIPLEGELRLLLMFRDITERQQAEQALRESEAKFRAIIEASPVAMAVSDVQQNITFLNPKFVETFGYTLAEIPNLAAWWSLAYPDPTYRQRVAERWQAAVDKAHRDGIEREAVEYAVTCKDGTLRDIRFSMAPMGTSSLVICYDLTELKRLENERREIFERITDAFVALDRNWCYTFVNPKAALMFGRRAEDLIGKHIWTEFPEGLGQPFHLAYEKAMAEQQAAIMEEYYPPYERWFENHIYPSPDGLTIYFHDITERKRAEAALAESRATLEALTRRLLEVQETERRSIARELHDEVGGALTAVKLNLQALRRPHTAEQGEAALADGLVLVDGAIQSVRSLSLDLRPAVLDDLGLIPALKWYCDRQARRAGVAIELALDAIDLKTVPHLESACFRIVQEAVTNALRHAGARRIQVTLRREDSRFTIEIADDGGGFDPAVALRGGLAGESSGLLGMEERARLLGGQFDIDSAPGTGARVRAEFVLSDGGFT